MRALFVALAIALVLAACSDISTNPSATPTDLSLANETLYCPAPFTAVSAGSPDPAAADNNGDGIACELVILVENQTEKKIVYVDNNVPVQLGICPEAFQAVAVRQETVALDRNGDAALCQATRPNGNVVIIDNRFKVENDGETPAEPAPPLVK